VPAFLSIDVEPDGFQDPHLGWTGFDAIDHVVDRLRSSLQDATGERPRFGWYLRMDPQVEHVHGRPDDVAAAHPERMARLRGTGDYFGAHVHALRWSAERDGWLHEFGDPDWSRHCIDVAFEAYAGVFGEAPVRHRYGAGYMDDAIVAALEERGVLVDLTLEPGTGGVQEILSGSDEAPMTAPKLDVTGIPRRPYRPARDDFRRPGAADARALVVVPLSSLVFRSGTSPVRTLARAVKHRRRPVPQPLYLTPPAAPLDEFWDRVSRHLSLQSHPYLSIAVRTDAPESQRARDVREILERLPAHPIARRLRFMDPLDALPSLLPDLPARRRADAVPTA
jgi:hypothetical protein